MHVASVGGEELLLLVEVLAVGGNHALGVQHQDVLLLCPDGHIELGTRDGGSPRSVHHDFHLLDVLAVHLQRVLQSGGRDDGRAVLVVVHHGDVEGALESFFDVEALRCLDVLQVDAAEGGCYLLHSLAELLGVLLGHFDVEHVNTTIYLEQQSLTFHDRLATHGPDVAQSEHCRTVGDDGHEVPLVRIAVGGLRVLLYFQAGVGHAGRVSQREVSLSTVSLRRLHFDFSGSASLVVFEGGFF